MLLTSPALASGEAPHPDDRRTRAHGAPDGGVTEGETLAPGGDEPVAVAGRGGRHADDRLGGPDGAGRAEEPCVTEVEDAAVGCRHPVAVARGGGRDAHDRLVEPDPRRRAQLLGGTEGIDGA